MEFAKSPCEICAKKGIVSWKRWHQLNREEAISFCENMECSDLEDSADIRAKIKPRKVTDWEPNSSPLKENLPLTTTTTTTTANSDTLSNRLTNDSVNVTSVSCTNNNNNDGFESILSEFFADTDLRDKFESPPPPIANLDFSSLKNRLSPQNKKPENQQLEPQIIKSPLSQIPHVENQSEVILKPNNPPEQFLLVTGTPPLPTPQTPTKFESIDKKIPVYEGPVLLDNQDKKFEPPFLNQVRVLKYPQWTNKDALCWLDVTLNLLVHNTAVKREYLNLNDGSTVKNTLIGYHHVVSSYNSDDYKNQMAVKLQSREDMEMMTRMENKIGMLMEVIRDKAFDNLKTKLQCMRGQEESPVFALPHLLNEEAMQKLFSIHYKLVFECDLCKLKETRSTQKVILTLPRVCNDFSVMNAFILTTCPRCESQDQKRSVKFDRLPSCVIMHFVEGLSNIIIDNYDFEFKHLRYKVTSIVQYKKNPNHFIVWIRNIKDDLWMECDDLKPGPSSFHLKSPTITDPSECHLLVWECVTPSTPPPNSPSLMELRDVESESSPDHDYCGLVTADNSPVKLTNETVTESGKKDDRVVIDSNNPLGSNLPIPNCLQLLDEASTECQDLVKHEPVNNFETFSEVLNLDPEPPVSIPSFMLENSNPQDEINIENSTSKNDDLYTTTTTNLPNSKSIPDSISSNQSIEKVVEDKMAGNLITFTIDDEKPPCRIVPPLKTENMAMNITDCTLVVTPDTQSGIIRPMPITLSCENAIELLKKFNKPVKLMIMPPKREIINCPIPPQVPTNIYQDPGLCEFNPQVIKNQLSSNRRYTRRATRAGRGQGRRPRRSRGGIRSDNEVFPFQENSFGVKNHQMVQNFNHPELPPPPIDHFSTDQLNPMHDFASTATTTTNIGNPSLLQFALKSKSNQSVANNNNVNISCGPIVNPGCKRKIDNPSGVVEMPIVKRINGTGVQLVRNNFTPSRRSSRSFDSYQFKTSNNNNNNNNNFEK